MSTLTPTKYSHIPRNGRSLGLVEFTLPIEFLLKQFSIWFLQQTLKCVYKGNSPDDELDFLDSFGIGDDILHCATFSTGLTPADQQWNGSWSSVEQLLVSVGDLCADTGSWRSHKDMLNDAAIDAAQDASVLFTQAIGEANSRYGYKAAAKTLLLINSQIRSEQERVKLQGSTNAAPMIRATLEAMQKVRRMLKKPTAKMRIAKKLAGWRWRNAFANPQQKKIRALADANNALQAVRFNDLERQVRLSLFPRLLKLTEQLRTQLDEQKSTFNALLQTLNDQPQSIPESATKVPVINSLFARLDRTSKPTLLDEFRERAEQAGCTPDLLAGQIRDEGIVKRKDCFLPHRWAELEPMDLLRRLVKTTRKYLGCADREKPLMVDDPRTATERCAQLDLSHPVIRKQLIHTLVREGHRAAPYAEFGQLHDMTDNIQTFVYCYPRDRTKYVDILTRQTNAIAEAKNAIEYATQHPYSLILLRYRIAAPIGAMPAFQRWSLLACWSENARRVKPLEPRGRHPEVRLLTQRVRCNTDCQTLFEAALKAGTVAQIGSKGHYVLTRDDNRFTALFAKPRWKTNAVPASVIQELLVNGQELSEFLTRQFSDQSDLHVAVAQLKNEHDPEVIAQELVKRRIFRPKQGAYALNAQFAMNPRWVPRELIRQEPGPLVGIARETFLARLNKDDMLYTVLFFAVMDAWQLKHLSKNDVPVAIVQFVKSLL